MRKRKSKFKPTSLFLQKAVDEYLARGGTITKLEFSEKAYQIFVSGSDSPIAVDEFLSGN